MSNQPTSSDRRAVQWLADGPTRAPDGLLSASLARTRATRQRSRWFTISLGDPGSETIGPWSAVAVRPLVVLLLAMSLIASALVAAGIARFTDRPILAVASPAPTPTTGVPLGPQRATDGVIPSPAGSVAPIPDGYIIAGWSVEIDNGPSLPWRSVEQSFNRVPIRTDDLAFPQVDPPYMYVTDGELALDFTFGPCDARFCQGPLLTLSLARMPAALVVDSTTCQGAGLSCVIENRGGRVPVTIAGTSLAELRDAWLQRLGPVQVEAAALDGEPAVVLHRGSDLVLVAVHADVQIAIITQPLGSGTAAERAAAFVQLVDDIRFVR